MALTFYTNPMSRGQIVRWMLEEVGEPYETVVLDYTSTMKADDYARINPMKKVPAIVHDGDRRDHQPRVDVRDEAARVAHGSVPMLAVDRLEGQRRPAARAEVDGRRQPAGRAVHEAQQLVQRPVVDEGPRMDGDGAPLAHAGLTR